ncbi:MAG TPA: AmmeMemoRadiSam system protein A [Aromatoleum sp.]|uniref:AmmeMemoRadiSam system protein A n=1 Tax=Aromatoleum sp. TaxID=2307007 RepID=UPI002B48F7D2|nr:AmmeMemoRadiSam system protein A [Aromatoleum sp.]HJV26607.1 AmmeMemoRadiSam system protein A [Aromatoleum sp.]
MPLPPDIELGPILLTRARQGILHEVAGHPAPQDDERLADRAATFVTLTRNGDLRGCIGSVRAQRSLADDVLDNAIGAATRDPRFPRVESRELDTLRVEVSLLSEPRFLEFAHEDELAALLRPHTDGLLLFAGCRSATFLPQVWEQLPDPQMFLAALKQKAGLAPDRPANNLMAATYTVRKWKEPPS